jgi:pyruvate formate lyase activating enzyme
MSTATVFNVQGFSIHDGPGIRTTVFLKGCPLKCFWCQNPEAQKLAPELFYAADKCTGCGDCVAACTAGAVSLQAGKSVTDRAVCRGAACCVSVCKAGARYMMGREATAEEVYGVLLEDRLFYDQSGGGVTLSGGEPLHQAAFASQLLRLCREAGIHTALDTCGYANWSVVRHVLEHTDLVLYDFKHMDSERHRAGTGVPNEVILQNARRICSELRIPMLARVPIVPGYNDDLGNLHATASFIAHDLDHPIPVHLNAYHRLGVAKLERLERPPGAELTAPPSETQMLAIQELFQSYGLTTFIGG